MSIWSILLWVLVGLGVVVGLFLLWALWETRASKPAPPLPPGKLRSDPATSPAQVPARLERLNAFDTERYGIPADALNSPCASVVIEPPAEAGPAKGTIVYFHGFTNCPAQFKEAGEALAARGWRVLTPRAPLHGLKDVLTHDLSKLTVPDLIDHVTLSIDAAAGFGEPLYVTGLSGGGILAAYAAATRREVTALLSMAPTTVPVGIPELIVRLWVADPWTAPNIYWWWDPRKKANLDESPYVYPGFPFPGIRPYLHMGRALTMHEVTPNHELAFANLMLNPGDFAIQKEPARRMMTVFDGHARSRDELVLAKQFGWWHDFIDVHGRHHAAPDEVAEILLDGLDVSDQARRDDLVSYREPADDGLARGKELDAARLDATEADWTAKHPEEARALAEARAKEKL